MQVKKQCKLKITRDERKIDDVSDETLSLFKPKRSNAIDQIKQKKKKNWSKYNLWIPQENWIFKYWQTVDWNNNCLVETNIIANRKTPKGFDSFQKLEVVEALVHALDTDTKQANITSNAETQTEFPKRDWFSLVTRETQTEGKSTLDAMT